MLPISATKTYLNIRKKVLSTGILNFYYPDIWKCDVCERIVVVKNGKDPFCTKCKNTKDFIYMGNGICDNSILESLQECKHPIDEHDLFIKKLSLSIYRTDIDSSILKWFSFACFAITIFVKTVDLGYWSHVIYLTILLVVIFLLFLAIVYSITNVKMIDKKA